MSYYNDPNEDNIAYDDAIEAEWDYVLSKPDLYAEYLFDHALDEPVTVHDGTEMPAILALMHYAPGWLRAQLDERLDKVIEENVERERKKLEDYCEPPYDF
jgi:hypothetical protein